MGTPESMIVVGCVIAFVLTSMFGGAITLIKLGREKGE